MMLPVIIVAAICLAIVLFAARIVVGWVSVQAAVRFDRAVDAFFSGFLKVAVVLIAVAVVAAVAYVALS